MLPRFNEKENPMTNRKLITLGMLAVAGILVLSTGRAQNGDSAKIDSVVGLTGPLSSPITPGKPFTFGVKAQYSLGSADVAILNIGVEEFPLSANGCTGSVHRTNGGSSIRIGRGSRNVGLKATWNGDRPVYPGAGVYLQLFITFSDPKAEKVTKEFGPSPGCYFAGCCSL
jgi:hypothetical protein